MADNRARAAKRNSNEAGLSQKTYMPHQDYEMERIVLGGIIRDNAKITRGEHIQKLRPEDFFHTSNREVFAAMLSLKDQGKEIDYVPLVDELTRTGMLDRAGGYPYISGLTDGLQDINQADEAAEVIKRLSALRQYDHIAAEILNKTAKPGANAIALGRSLAEQFSDIADDVERPRTCSDMLVPDMKDDVLDGWLGELCQKSFLSTGLPLSYSWLSLLTVAGMLAPPSPDGELRTNLYSCLVGGVGSGKTISIERACSVLGLRTPILQNQMAGSAEGLMTKLSDADGAARLVNPDELGHLLSKAQIDNASFPYVLNSAFYKTKFEMTAAHRKSISVNCRLGLIGGVVTDRFQDLFGSSTTGGLHDRFLFGLEPSPSHFHWRPFDSAAKITDPCDVTVAPDVWEVRDEWLKTIPGLRQRHAENALRVAKIVAAFSGRSVLRASALGPTRALAEYQAQVRTILKPNPGENPDARCANSILDVLDAQDGWIEERKLSRKINSSRFGPGVFRRAIQNLEFNREILVVKEGPARIRRRP